jgi:drug/metabolite transporter (DMT)-like permease
VSGARAPILVAAFVMVIWGASPAMTKIAGEDFTTLQIAVLRTVLAGVVALPIVLVTRQRLPAGRRRQLLLLISAVSGFVAFPLLFTFGQQRTSAMHGNMILAALPLCTGAYAAILDRRRPTQRWLVGCGLALAGEVALVAIRTGSGGTQATVLGDALVVASALVVAVGYVAGARLGQLGYHALAATYWGVIGGALLMAPLLAATLASDGLPDAGPHAWGAVLWMAILTSIVGYVGWYWALARGGIQRIATIQFLQSISGLVLAAWLLGEQFTVPLVIASVAILAGVTITQRGSHQRATR